MVISEWVVFVSGNCRPELMRHAPSQIRRFIKGSQFVLAITTDYPRKLPTDEFLSRRWRGDVTVYLPGCRNTCNQYFRILAIQREHLRVLACNNVRKQIEQRRFARVVPANNDVETKNLLETLRSPEAFVVAYFEPCVGDCLFCHDLLAQRMFLEPRSFARRIAEHVFRIQCWNAPRWLQHGSGVIDALPAELSFVGCVTDMRPERQATRAAAQCSDGPNGARGNFARSVSITAFTVAFEPVARLTSTNE